MVKIERSYPAPASLEIEKQKANGSYNKPDVVEQLRKDFHDKCYICELNGLADVNVEHLLPHKNGSYVDRKFDWDNLFLACPHCNFIKNKSKYDGGILDCCVDDPEERIDFRFEQDKVHVFARHVSDAQAKLTAELVEEVFEERNTGIKTYASDVRYNELRKEMNKLYDNLEELTRNPQSRYCVKKIEALLRRESKFAAFKRNYVRNHADAYPQLVQFLA